jgi:V/A-type H+/Na+-transporting ATPase subunit E
LGEQRIIDAIIGDAKKEAAGIIEAANEQAKDALASAANAAQARACAIAKTATADGEELVRRAMLGASLEARKNSLASRRELLEKAFENAFSSLCRLENDDYINLITKLVCGASETGSETLLVPSDVYDRYAKPYKGGKTMLEILNDALKKAGKKGELSLAESQSRDGGVRLVGVDADLDCSFKALVASLRDEKETEISKLLFGSEE